MSEYAQYYEAFCQGYWANENADHCRCHGGGWALSEVDTWHRCPIHGHGVPHPEDRDNELAFEDWAKANPAEHALLLAEAEATAQARLVEVEAWAFRNDDDVPF